MSDWGEDCIKYEVFRADTDLIDEIPKCIERYIDKVGVKPTLLLVNPHDLDMVTPLFPDALPYGYVFKGELWLTHLVSKDGFSAFSYDSPKTEDEQLEEESEVVDIPNSPKKPPSKAKPSSIPMQAAYCPVCNTKIDDFNKLGYWPGWALDIIPPYWGELRQFVFKRDSFACQICKKKFTSRDLRAHHIEPKEKGGVDAAWNLISHCRGCHIDDKPIFEDEVV